MDTQRQARGVGGGGGGDERGFDLSQTSYRIYVTMSDRIHDEHNVIPHPGG